MVSPIPTEVRKFWDEWNIRGVILFSLFLQAFMTLFAPLRRKTRNKIFTFSIYSAYLLADWAANITVGLIADNQKDNQADTSRGSADNSSLLVFWSSFLLIHLGGPDTITAYALEDNELWHRQLLSLIFQIIAVTYIFLLTIPHNKLWIPTLAVFFAGIIKYAERIRALYLASIERFREGMLTEPDPGPNYAKLMEEYSSRKAAYLPTQISTAKESERSKTYTKDAKISQEKLKAMKVVERAYYFFDVFKGLIVDLIFSFRERDESRKFFQGIKEPVKALEVIAVELKFMYDVLYTKVAVVNRKSGYVFRSLSFALVVSALVIFHFQIDKHNYHKYDTGITYTVLLASIVIDFISFWALIYSEWTEALLEGLRKDSVPADILYKIIAHLRLKKRIPLPILHRRWSESIQQFNLVTYCLKECSEKEKLWLGCTFGKCCFSVGHLFDRLLDYFGLTNFWDEVRYVDTVQFTPGLWNFIFKDLQEKSEMEEAKEQAKAMKDNGAKQSEKSEKCGAAALPIHEQRGERVLEIEECKRVPVDLAPYISEVDYDQSLLIWHIATKICHSEDEKEETIRSESVESFSKILSDYMLFLLIMRSTLMSPVAGIGRIRFRDTCSEAKRFYERKGINPEEAEEACERALRVIENIDVKPADVKGDRSKSVFFDGCKLAKELRKLGKKKWDVISKVWVDLLSYAACHCQAIDHVEQVSQGGELITFVWLLMVHFGLVEQFQINEGHARAKLIVDIVMPFVKETLERPRTGETSAQTGGSLLCSLSELERNQAKGLLKASVKNIMATSEWASFSGQSEECVKNLNWEYVYCHLEDSLPLVEVDKYKIAENLFPLSKVLL